MVPIKIKRFVKLTAEKNKDINEKELIKALKLSLEAKENGAECYKCGKTIWAAGSAITGMNMCFRCITLETDDIKDYEVIR